MIKWNKKNVPLESAKEISEKYGTDLLTASILIRRGITDGKDILYFLENDKRFLHNPFLFKNMEDVVDRILQAQDEGEIVMIFGDRDVDGISSTTILYDQLVNMGLEVECRLPGGNDGYGLSVEAVDDFYSRHGTLIITVDCGISNNAEIAYAAEKGIDVIVLDHHNPPADLPSPAVIIDPKCEDSGYPFQDISGAAVAYKTVKALRFAVSDNYKQEICLLNAQIKENKTVISALKVQNLVKTGFLEEEIADGQTDFSRSKTSRFLQGQAIFAWDKKETLQALKAAFGSGIEFSIFDAREMISKSIPQVRSLSLGQLKTASKIARYDKSAFTEIEGFYNIFVTYASMEMDRLYPENIIAEEKDLQLVALAALADIIPLKNENRIFVRQGIQSINEGKARPGLVELLSKLDLLGKPVNSTKLSWNIVPVLNATGRLGQPELGLELFKEKDNIKRDQLADQIIALNNQRKQLGAEAWSIGNQKAQETIARFAGKLCVVIDENINRGVSGILAGRLVSEYRVPSMAITFVGDTAMGSMRSCRGFSVTPFLDKMSDIFINHGGHDQAAGFSFEKNRLQEFEQRLTALCSEINLSDDDEETVDIDAELQQKHLTPELLQIVDKFEPYGEGNPELNFLSRNLRIQDGLKMGKPEPTHLKLILDCGQNKWPAIFFGEAARLNRDFNKGDNINVIYQVQRNVFNGNVTPQMILKEIFRNQVE